jgi:hypothetical protein
MLRALGQPAEVALLRTNRDDPVDLPGVEEFDHAIVVLPGAPAVWIDPTSPETPVGRLPPGDQGKLAMVASPATAGLVRTPEDRLGDNGADVDMEVALAEIGPARVVRTTTFRGANATAERAALRQLTADELAHQDAAYVEEVGAEGVLVTATREGVDRPGAPLRSRFDIARSRWAWTNQDDAEAGCGPIALLRQLPERLRGAPTSAQGRELEGRDMSLYSLLTGELRYTLTPPLGFQVAETPDPLDREVGPLHYERRIERGGDEVVRVVHRMRLTSRSISAADVERIRAAVTPLLKEDVHVRFERTAAVLLKAGKVREALELLRKLAAIHPREARHHAHYALALLDAGMGEPARRAADLAVEREPYSAYGHRVRALTLASDAMGRWLAPGCDVPGAVAEQRRAVELEPGAAAESQLAFYLETAPGGLRFGPGARVDEALALRKAVRARYGDRAHDDQLLETEIAAGRFADALALAREAKDSAARRAALVVALAAERGGKAVGAELDGWRSQERSDGVTDALRLLLRTRSYGVLAALVEATSSAAPSADVAALAGLRRIEAVRVDAGDPALLLPRLVQAVLDPGAGPAALDGLLADELRGGVDVRDAARAMGGAMGESSGEADLLPPAALIDLVFSLAKATVTGDDETGYRIEYQTPGNARRFVVYGVREHGTARLLATEDAYGPLGLRALRLLSAGQAAAARRVLRWVADDSSADTSPGDTVRVLLAQGDGTAELALAAAALGCYAEHAGPALDRVARARGEARDPRVRRVLTRALTVGLELAERWEELRTLAAEAGPEQPDSAFSAQVRALEALGRAAPLRDVARDRLQRRPRDPLAQRALATAASLAGDDAEALRLVRANLPERATPADLERAAWMGLLVTPADDTTLDHARRAASLDRKRRATGRVLAAVSAERGDPAQAMRQLQGAASRWGTGREAGDWLVMGRAAEAYGLTDLARSCYREAAEARGADRVVKLLAARWATRVLRASPAEPPPP